MIESAASRYDGIGSNVSQSVVSPKRANHGRKNRVFFGSDASGDRAGGLHALVESAKLEGAPAVTSRSVGAAAERKKRLEAPATARPLGRAAGVDRHGGQVTLGAISGISAPAVASMPKGMLPGLLRREGESWGDLLLRLNKAVMQSVVENRVIDDLQL